MHRAGRPAGVGSGRKILAARAGGVVADGEVALDEIHLLPIVVDEGSGREHAGLKAEETGAAAAAAVFVERPREDLLLDARRIPGRHFPAGRAVDEVEIEMRLADLHRGHPLQRAVIAARTRGWGATMSAAASR